jgi:hypothetical protein
MEDVHSVEKATRYLGGNSLLALQMTQHDPAGLYAPSRVALSEQ